MQARVPLDAVLDPRLDALLGMFLLDPQPHPGDESFSHPGLALDLCDEVAEGIGLGVAKGQILKLRLHAPHTEPVRQRRVDLHRLVGIAELRRRGQMLERAHVVESIRQLHEKDPDVLDHRQQQLAEILSLLLLARREADLADLGNALDQAEDLFAELFSDLCGSAWVSSRTSCNRPTEIDVGSSPCSVRIIATARGCIKYGSPDIRSCPLCTLAENSCARRTRS